MDTKGEMSSARRTPQRTTGDHVPGQNVGPDITEREAPLPTAYDVKEVHRALHEFTDDDLKQIPILPHGTRLQQGATYIDLAADHPEPFKSTGAITSVPGHYYVPKDKTPYTVWNRLIGEPKPGQ